MGLVGRLSCINMLKELKETTDKELKGTSNKSKNQQVEIQLN